MKKEFPTGMKKTTSTRRQGYYVDQLLRSLLKREIAALDCGLYGCRSEAVVLKIILLLSVPSYFFYWRRDRSLNYDGNPIRRACCFSLGDVSCA